MRTAKGQFIKRSLNERMDEWLTKVSISSNGCWEWAGSLVGSGKGYPVIRDENGKRIRVGRLMLVRNGKPKPSEKHIACHACDNSACVNPAHLFWGTVKDNAIDASRKGRSNKPTGEHLEKIKSAAKELWKKPGFRETHLARIAEAVTTDSFRMAVKGGIILSTTHNRRRKDM